MENNARYPRFVWAFWGPLLLWTAAGGTLRLCAIRESLWLDELHTAWCISGAFAEVARRAMIGNQTPLFYWTEWLTTRLIDQPDWALRLVPWAASTGTIALVYWAVHRRTASQVWSSAVAALVALDSHSLFYGSEARPYGLIPLVAFIHLDTLLCLCCRSHNQCGRRAGFFLWASWVASGILLLHLHLATLWLLVWEYVLLWLGRVVHKGSSIDVRRLLGASVVLAVAFIPLLPLAHAAYGRLPAFALMVDRPGWVELLSLLNLGYYVLAGGLLLLAATKLAGHSKAKTRPSAHVVLAFLLWLVPTVSAWLVARAGVAPVFFPRYLIALQASGWLFLAECGVALRFRQHRLLVGALGVIFVGVALTHTSYPRWMQLMRGEPLRAEDWREALGALAEQFQPGDVILFRPGLIETEQIVDRPAPGSLEYEYLCFPLRSFYSPTLHTAKVVLLDNSNTPDFSARDLTAMTHARHLYLLVRGDVLQAKQLAYYITGRLADTKISTSVRSYGRVQLIGLISAQAAQN